MNEQDLRKMVEQMVEQMVSKDTSSTSTSYESNSRSSVASMVSGECLPDITKIDLRKQFLVDDAKDKEGYLAMKAKTPARLGVGRAGLDIKQ